MSKRKKTTEKAEAAETARLTVPEVTEGLRLTAEELEVLSLIAAGKPVGGRQPGIREVTQALALKASMSVAKPRAEESERERTPVVVGCPYCGPCDCQKKRNE